MRYDETMLIITAVVLFALTLFIMFGVCGCEDGDSGRDATCESAWLVEGMRDGWDDETLREMSLVCERLGQVAERQGCGAEWDNVLECLAP